MIIRFFSILLKTLENFTAHLSLFDLSRCKTIMCFAQQKKNQGKIPTDFTEFHLKFEKFWRMNQTFYKKFETCPTEEHTRLIENTLDESVINGDISEAVAEGLKPSNPKTPRSYMLPKIHKNGNPGRPVVSSVKSHNGQISKYVDHHIQPLAKNLRYVKDITDFINKFKNVGTVPKGAYLVSMDVYSLFTNISNDEGLEALRESLDKHERKSCSTKVIVTFMKLILLLNNFVFNGLNYLQIKGCAMCTNSAPSYANVLMGKIEETFIYPITNLHKLYLRYIDDIFIRWTGTSQQFIDFIGKLNQKHLSIKFEYHIFNKAVASLDTTVYIDENNRLQTKLYRKRTDWQNYLHRKSEHPTNLKINIPCSQALRIKRICSAMEEFDKSCDTLGEKFIQRGYSRVRSGTTNKESQRYPKRVLYGPSPDPNQVVFLL